MPRFKRRQPPFNEPLRRTLRWESFQGGVNTLFDDTEIGNTEVAQFQNLMLVGKGIPTKRWGLGTYFTSSATGSVRGMGGYYQLDGDNELLAITDEGYLNKKNGSSFTQINGVSWASGTAVEMAQLSDTMYMVGGGRELVKYDGSTLAGFATIAQPSGIGLSQLSGATGSTTHSYRLTHTTSVGQTLPATSVTLGLQPEDTTNGPIRIAWTNASAASGVRTGTNIYKGDLGYETFVAKVDAEATFWIDDGSAIPTLFGFVPKQDTTGGINAKYILRFQDRLVYAGIDGDPTLVVISGAEPQHERTDFGSNGGFVRIEPDSGDDITGLGIKADKIIVFKEKSVWQISLTQKAYKTVNDITLTALDPQVQLITASIGCASQRSVANVENDILFVASGGRGVYVLGNEPGIIGDILRTNEVSVKIRPFFEDLTPAQEKATCAAYFNNKYFVGVPGKGETMVFDRERNAWMGPWTFDANMFHVYYDDADEPFLLKGDSDGPTVGYLTAGLRGDYGSAFETILRTKREDFRDFSRYKVVENIFTLWREVSGSVSADIRLEEREGNTITAQSFTIGTQAGNAGWGADQWGDALWGDSEESGSATSLTELVQQSYIQRTARNVQLIIKTNNINDNYKLMAVRGEAHILGEYRPTSWQV